MKGLNVAESTMTLREALSKFDKLAWSDAIFVDKARPVNLETSCLVHDPDDVDDEEVDLPGSAISLGFDYLIDVQTFKSICINLKGQNFNADMDDLLTALLFYLKNDAFIVLG